MKKRLICLFLLLCITVNTYILSSCSIIRNNDIDDDVAVNGSESITFWDESLESEFELPPPPTEKPAIIHMIQPTEMLEGWQSGKTEHSASLYVDDIMKVLDSLEWEKASDGIEISSDFHFRINLYRPQNELEPFFSFVDLTESDQEESKEVDTDTTPTDDGEQDSISVQYLINIDDKIVNMRFSDYSAQTFDIYAPLGETDVKILVLCLKYYFGAY